MSIMINFMRFVSSLVALFVLLIAQRAAVSAWTHPRGRGTHTLSFGVGGGTLSSGFGGSTIKNTQRDSSPANEDKSTLPNTLGLNNSVTAVKPGDSAKLACPVPAELYGMVSEFRIVQLKLEL